MTKTEKTRTSLSRRERQIMDIIYEAGETTAVEVRDRLPDPPSNSSVRKMLSILESKGHIKHEGPRYVYLPTVSREKAKSTALKHVMQTFFENSAESVVAALMGISGREMTDKEYDRLSEMIEASRKERKERQERRGRQ